jgi:hypothetical protein
VASPTGCHLPASFRLSLGASVIYTGEGPITIQTGIIRFYFSECKVIHGRKYEKYFMQYK